MKKNQNDIVTKPDCLEINVLYKNFKNGELNFFPSLEQSFVLDKKKYSHFIALVLSDMPVPMIYISEEKNGKEYVIDGQNRFNYFFSFIDGGFELTGLREYKELNGLNFNQLSEELKKKILAYKIIVNRFKNESGNDLRQEIFMRLGDAEFSLMNEVYKKAKESNWIFQFSKN